MIFKKKGKRASRAADQWLAGREKHTWVHVRGAKMHQDLSELRCFLSAAWTSSSLWITGVNICRCRLLGTCWGVGTCLCRTLARMEQIRMKYWVHLWISGAERPLAGASARIFSWWKPFNGSFLFAASLNSESQKCKASWRKHKKSKIRIYRGGTAGFPLLRLKIWTMEKKLELEK